MRVWISVSAIAWRRPLGSLLSSCCRRDGAQFLSWLLIVVQGKMRPPKKVSEVCDGILGLVAHAAQGVSLLEETGKIEDCQRGDGKQFGFEGNTLNKGFTCDVMLF